MVKEIMETDNTAMETDFEAIWKMMPPQSDTIRELFHKAFQAGYSSGSIQTIKTFMVKVMPLMYSK